MSEDRIQQLLECNNRELEKRRAAERRADEAQATFLLAQSELLDMIKVTENLLEYVVRLSERSPHRSLELLEAIDAGRSVVEKYHQRRGP